MIPYLGLLLLSTTSAVANDVSRRDIQAIQNALNEVNLELERIDIAILELQSGTAPALEQLEATSITALQNATLVIQASERLDMQNSESLAAATDALRSNLNVTVIDAVRQKSVLDALNLTSMIQQALGPQRAAARQ